MEQPWGYMGEVLRVDLSAGTARRVRTEPSFLDGFVGGLGLGARILYDEVLPGVAWNDPANRLVFATGPLNATSLPGSGTICGITKGALTEGVASSQANGYLGAYLKTCGLDAVIIQGAASDWKYLQIDEARASIVSASKYVGLDTIDSADAIRRDMQGRERSSIYCIGPAGEHGVKYSMILGDTAHVLAHNGFGAVMGSKMLKGIAVSSGRKRPRVRSPDAFNRLAKEMGQQARAHPVYGKIHRFGTSMLWPSLAQQGLIPVKNLTTCGTGDYSRFSREVYGDCYPMRWLQCWACPMKHVQMLTIGGANSGSGEIKDPEYECAAAWSVLIGNEDFESAAMLSDHVDRLGLDANEAGWTVALAIECFEKGILTKDDVDGLALTWGNVEAVRALLNRIAWREGFGAVLAEGVAKAGEMIGGDAVKYGVYVKKGHAPRTHDGRARWSDVLDYASSGVGTSESNSVRVDEPWEANSVASAVKQGKVRAFVDSLVVCNLPTMTYAGSDISDLVRALNLCTASDIDSGEALQISLRITNLVRAFNIRHGHTVALESPSERYASTPESGPIRGKSLASEWPAIISAYYAQMGWDPGTGKPLLETLQSLGLNHVASDLWSA